jgi:peptidoglycan LD-endopeptidase LytH
MNFALLASALLLVGRAGDASIDFNSLNTRIRDGRISRNDAQHQLRLLLPQLAALFYQKGGAHADKSSWRFPVQGYGARAIGGANGSGYLAAGYEYFDGDAHKGHPAHDIFIKDRNQDGIDDVTKQPVNVLSMTPGIVVAMATTWDTASTLRGGRYVWIYDPNSGSFFYYAHNSDVLVHLLDLVKPGDTIAHVGRTGFNAFKKRSPTHLHLMQLMMDSTGVPRPVNLYGELKRIGR